MSWLEIRPSPTDLIVRLFRRAHQRGGHMDYRVTFTNATDPEATAQEILETHGDDYDASRGDFTVDVEEGKIVVEFADVADGDIEAFIEAILAEHALEARASKREGSNWFALDLPLDD